MKRSIFGYIATLCAGVCMTFASCSEKEEPVAPEPKCTVLVYMVADNNLGGYAVLTADVFLCFMTLMRWKSHPGCSK